MKRTARIPASPPGTVHVNGSSSKRPKRKWRPEVERDRSMRAYELNPRALRLTCLTCRGTDIDPLNSDRAAECRSCGGLTIEARSA